MRQRPCKASDVVTSARLSPALDGVLGVIVVTGKSCSLTVDVTKIRLLGADGRALNVPAGKGNPVNPPDELGSGFAEAAGSVSVGFAWTGSYCGPAANSLTIPLLPATLRIRLVGASPTCRSGNRSLLVSGIVDRPGAPVEPAPRAWLSLRARLVLPAVVKPGPIPASVVLTNSAPAPVSLSGPCPTAAAGMVIPLRPSSGVHGESEAAGSNGGDLCRVNMAVPAKSSLTVQLGKLSAAPEDPRNPWWKGEKLTVEWGMAGVPMAQATATIG
jgi:hypothetical protein